MVAGTDWRAASSKPSASALSRITCNGCYSRNRRLGSLKRRCRPTCAIHSSKMRQGSFWTSFCKSLTPALTFLLDRALIRDKVFQAKDQATAGRRKTATIADTGNTAALPDMSKSGCVIFLLRLWRWLVRQGKPIFDADSDLGPGHFTYTQT